MNRVELEQVCIDYTYKHNIGYLTLNMMTQDEWDKHWNDLVAFIRLTDTWMLEAMARLAVDYDAWRKRVTSTIPWSN